MLGSRHQECVCSAGEVVRYRNRISAPLMDRIDLHLEVAPVPFDELSARGEGESSATIRRRVLRARDVQALRFAAHECVHCNAQMSMRMVREFAPLDRACRTLMKTALQRLGLSARAYGRILKVARTIADLDGSRDIRPEHLAEAIQYRSRDRHRVARPELEYPFIFWVRRKNSRHTISAKCNGYCTASAVPRRRRIDITINRPESDFNCP